MRGTFVIFVVHFGCVLYGGKFLKYTWGNAPTTFWPCRQSPP